MNFYNLEVFMTVTRSRSLTQAAADLHISQSAVSLHIRALESELGVRLLERSTHPIALTPSGEILQSFAKSTLHHLQKLREMMSQPESGLHGRVRIGSTRAWGAYSLAPVLHRFKRLHPGVEVSATSSGTNAIAAQLQDGRIDLGIVVVGGLPPGLVVRQLRHEKMVAVAAPKNPVVSHRLSVDDLRQLPMVITSDSSHRHLLDTQLQRFGLTDYRVYMELGDPEAVKQVVMMSDSIAILPWSCVAVELHEGKLMTLSLVGMDLTVHYAMAFSSALKPPPVVETLAEFMRSNFGSPDDEYADSRRALESR